MILKKDMEWVDIVVNKKEEYNALVDHPLQSFEWGEFREKTGVKVVRRGLLKNGKLTEGFTVTVHKVPKTKFTIGYLPKGSNPSKELLEELEKVGRENNSIFIQLEPNVIKGQLSKFKSQLFPSFHPLFTKYTFVLDITKSEDELLKSFHSKTRYNIKVAQKHGVVVSEENSEKAFAEYLKLTEETTTRQRFFAHTPTYHKKMWETLGGGIAHLFTAKYNKKTLTAWIIFVFHDTLYYPYGASSSEHRNVMASNLIMWEAIKYGKNLGLKNFDMWGALGPEPNQKDPWYGFHKFKEGYGATLTEFVGSYDLVLMSKVYKAYKVADKLRWGYLRLRKIF